MILTDVRSLLKQPCAVVPLGMSFAALALVLGHAAIFGVVHETDEGCGTGASEM